MKADANSPFRSQKSTLILAAFLPLVFARAVAADTLVVLNKSDHEAALVDPAAYQVVAKLPTGRGPHEVATSPDGHYAYVSNYGQFGLLRQGEPPKREPGNTITVLNLREGKLKTTFDLGSYTQPHGLAVSGDGSRVWVTCEGAQSVLELDAPTGKILKAWKTNQQTSHMVVPTPDEKKLYLTNIGSGSVSVINRSTDAVATIPTGAGAEGIAISPDGRQVWVANRAANTLSVMDTASDKVVASLESGGRMPIRVKFTLDGKQVWVSNARSNAVAVFDASSRHLLATIAVGAVPVGIEMAPDGKRAFVANTNDNQVTVLDVPARKLLRTFSTGTEPDGMAWAALILEKIPGTRLRLCEPSPR
ncbi:MAG TPA: beta-propeller fold lactonase family protein [Candidatus Acidoferrales bacterium]|nr:beta-propeller fold lactonase family protein [Candidatus Acidoferrales bacterium]